MIDRNALIVRNRVEALDRRRADLHRQIAVAERQNAELTARYNERLAAAAAARLQTLQRVAYRQSFAVGLALSLVVGLIVAFH
jgi:hypothetical protein